ncbi:MAG: GNAT family N-acetyltransferase [Chloroflexota bacterium]|nr:GNAT family N-acetyltransferase [Chloroflexota bacterium]
MIAGGGLLVERVGDTDAIAGGWDDLARASRNIFSTREWVGCWSRHFPGRIHLFAARQGERLVAVVPLVATGSVARLVHFAGHGPSDELAPVTRPAERALGARALLLALRRVPHDVFVGSPLPAGTDWGALLHAAAVRHQSSPVLRVDATRADRSHVPKAERALRRDHQVVMRLSTDDVLERDLDTLFALHRARWSDPSPFSRSEAFHREFARIALARQWLRLWMLEVDGRVVAAQHSFRFAGVESFYQAGRDPAWAPASVGRILLAHAVREALADQVEEYRLLRGGEAYKYGIANEDAQLVTVARAGSPVGALGLLTMRAMSRWRPPMLLPLRRAFVRHWG